VCDGERFLLLPAARDYKRALDGDRGPNTGGMGAVAPAPAVGEALEQQVGRRIVGPVLQAMAARGTPFRGVLYCGLMIVAGEPRVLEFNARFGDPEAQAVLPLLEGSLARLLASAARGALEPDAVSRASGAAVVVTLVDRDYPDAVSGDGVIVSLEDAEQRQGVTLFHAGTAYENGAWRVRGGRALHVMAQDPVVEAARERAYAAIATLGGRGWRCRGDIAAPPARSAAPAHEPERAGNAGFRP
jgi:phosphoribosylamine---glycine ligase